MVGRLLKMHKACLEFYNSDVHNNQELENKMLLSLLRQCVGAPSDRIELFKINYCLY